MKYTIFIKINNIDVMCFKIKADSEEEAIEKCKKRNKIIFYEKYRTRRAKT